MSNVLIHTGVKGMKWGQRKAATIAAGRDGVTGGPTDAVGSAKRDNPNKAPTTKEAMMEVERYRMRLAVKVVGAFILAKGAQKLLTAAVINSRY